MHEHDWQCTVVEDACIECGVGHNGAPCPCCGNVAFHEEGCRMADPSGNLCAAMIAFAGGPAVLGIEVPR